MSTPEHDPQAYVRCMQEVKQRINILDDAISPWRYKGILSIPRAELSALQLRKIYELIGFSLLSTNKGQFTNAWKHFSREWNLGKILGVVQKKNKDFMPKPTIATSNPQPGVRLHLSPSNVPVLTGSDVVKRHGRLGHLLHARNPFHHQVKYEEELKQIIEEIDHVVKLLDRHRTVVIPKKITYYVEMLGQDNQVHCYTLDYVEERPS